MPTLGEDCHIILTHPNVNGGEPYGFVCVRQDSLRAEGVQLVREVITQAGDVTLPATDTRLWSHFDVLLGDDLTNPDGLRHVTTRAQDYALLLDYLSRTSGIVLTTPVGSLANMGSLGWSADERHYPEYSIIKCQLNNVGYYFPPADPVRLEWSRWWDTSGDPGDPSLPYLLLTWDTSYWR